MLGQSGLKFGIPPIFDALFPYFQTGVSEMPPTSRSETPILPFFGIWTHTMPYFGLADFTHFGPIFGRTAGLLMLKGGVYMVGLCGKLGIQPF